MTPQQFEAAFLAQTAFRLALSDNVDELIAVASVIRNWVIPKPGRIAQYHSYPQACIDFLKTYPVRDFPNMTEDCLVSPNGLLSVIDSIWDCAYPDLTATQTTPGAMYFGRSAAIDESDWRFGLIRSRPVLATFGAQQFW